MLCVSVQPSALFLPFLPKGTSSGLGAPVGRTGLAPRSYIRNALVLRRLFGYAPNLPKMQLLSLKGEFVGLIYLSSKPPNGIILICVFLRIMLINNCFIHYSRKTYFVSLIALVILYKDMLMDLIKIIILNNVA